jgi:3-hydroxyisobutyrate dehydrogenase
MAKIAFLGTGNMGIGMAGRLLDAGHQLTVYNRTRKKAEPLIDKGAVFSKTPKQAATNADAIFSMVSDDVASRHIWTGEEGALNATLSQQALVIECSTLSHRWVIELSKIVKQRGLTYLDCPVTGMLEAAASGSLTLFLGGDQSTIERAQPFLTPVSNGQIHFGEIGSGTAYKLMVNLMGSIQIAAAAEGLLIAEKAGLDLNLVTKALATGAAASPNVIRTSRQMVQGKHEQNILFNASLRLKDSLYGVAHARELGQSAIFGNLAAESFQALVDDGFGESSESKVIDVLRDGINQAG